jgi:hypothetical protein
VASNQFTQWQPSELAARQQVFEASIETDQMLALMDDGGG